MIDPPTSLEDRLVHITDPTDPRIAEYRDVREADLVGRRGLFIAEGEMVLRTAIDRSQFRLRSVLIGRARLRTLAPWLERAHPDAAIYLADGPVMDAIAGYHIHRGVLAVGERAAVATASELLTALGDGPRLVVCLESLTNHDNVGSVFRNSAAFGVDAVLLDERCCDPLYRKAIRVSIGAALVVPYARAPRVAELVAALRAAGYTTFALTPRAGSVNLADFRAPGRMPARLALLLGTEGPGLTDEAIDLADHAVRIEIHPKVDAVNVATAGAIAMHEYRCMHPIG
jgi:tRNA G18 (ribose-2'-O)-methylase SpoU